MVVENLNFFYLSGIDILGGLRIFIAEKVHTFNVEFVDALTAYRDGAVAADTYPRHLLQHILEGSVLLLLEHPHIVVDCVAHLPHLRGHDLHLLNLERLFRQHGFLSLHKTFERNGVAFEPHTHERQPFTRLAGRGNDSVSAVTAAAGEGQCTVVSIEHDHRRVAYGRTVAAHNLTVIILSMECPGNGQEKKCQ